MNKGIGIDIIEIERIKEALARRPRLRERLFSPEEIAYCQGKRCPAASFAARFAAKEAVRKACSEGSGVEIMPWREIEIVSEGGRPWVRLSGNSARLAEKKGIVNLLVSLSHCRTYACAVVLAVGVQRSEDLSLERVVDGHEAGKGC
ncbi:MAG TPA: holo-ACP synthase [Syntrophomonadaceae bacterium]|nr:holo-ACP synthase [Syntrophomonadaceae bacterium]